MRHLMNNSLSTLQWFIFMITSSIALPIVIGSAFHLSAGEVEGLVQRTLFIVGLSSFLQGWIGHRMPLMDGPAGSWVSVFVLFADVAVRHGQQPSQSLQLLEGGLLVAGVLLILLGATGAIYKILPLFTPLVTGSFLLLLVVQLSGVFLKGMLGIHGETDIPNYGASLIAFGIFGLVVWLSSKGKGWSKTYAILIGIAGGWIIFALIGKAPFALSAGDTPFVKLPEVFAWGPPEFNAGIVTTAVLFTITLVSNTIAAVTAVSEQLPEANKDIMKRRMNRASLIGGVSHMLTASASTVGVVPLPVSAGFIRMTGQRSRGPFLAACLLLVGIGTLPVVLRMLSQVPGQVASAVLLASFVQLAGISFASLSKETNNQRGLTILGVAMLVGIGIMFLPPNALAGLPPTLQDVVGNGLLVGTLIVIALERLWKKPAAVLNSGP
ncbi:xanthine permease [Paenibacillus radicis (ex Gao et al. 2016)]|uniref:Xanthine permease n=2 Tax=Paenibacillus radicis (ex Gao et al. 2016) TaxID=1737354 RepID=A0A917LY95_9BACL|nr:xanthine permease [Paenibacillus radicis (ex Gao et al. 2016)]